MIAKMQKVRISVLKNDYENLIAKLQKAGILMINDTFFDNKSNTDMLDEYLERSKRMIKILDSLTKKKKFFDYKTVKEEDFDNDFSESIALLERAEDSYQRIHETKEKKKAKVLELNRYLPFKEALFTTNDIEKSEYVNILLGFIDPDDKESLSSFDKGYIEFYNTSEEGLALAVACLKNDYNEVLEQLNDIGFRNANFDSFDLNFKELIEKVEGEIASLDEITKKSNDFLAECSNEILKIRLLADQLANAKIRKQIVGQKSENYNHIYIEGFIKEVDKSKLTDILKKIPNCLYDFKEPRRNEKVPTATINKKLVRPFENITNMFSVPNSNEMDPNFLMSIWYWLCFGFMMGDIGYGLVMIIASLLFIKLKRPKEGIKALATIFYYAGFSTIIFGILFGSCFGEEFGVIRFVGKIFSQDWPIALLNPVNEPLPVLIFSIVFGAFHIICALVMKAIVNYKKKNIVDMLNAIGWITALIGILVLVVGMTNIVPIGNTLGIVLIGIALALIIYSSAAKAKGIKKISAGLGGVYGAFNYLSDLLSYSRLLALCLSSAVIAYTMNLLAGMVIGVIFPLGFLFAIIIYLIGHVFNLVLSLLSGYIHSSRLQYIEFFGKFYEGGGIEFKPLKVELNYIDNIES